MPYLLSSTDEAGVAAVAGTGFSSALLSFDLVSIMNEACEEEVRALN